ncbi:MAG: tol-pal system YbgF family protein [Candidatus Thorarchaeota archaeon]
MEMGKSKIQILWLVLAAMSVPVLAASPVLSNQIIINSEDQFSFARSIMDSGDFSRAVVEFERFIHFFPENSQVQTARYLIGICRLRDQRFQEARESFSEVIRTEPAGPLSGRALFLTGESYYQQGLSNQAAYYFNQIIEKYTDLDLKNAALYRLGWTKMNASRWCEASRIFSDVERQSTFFESAQQLAEKSLKGEALPQKNPTYAGLMSAIVPGLGHAYVSRYKDATVAFVVNGLFIWGAVQSFRQDQNVVGGILTFLEIGWYSGNIYSAVNATHKYNRKVHDDFRGSLKDRLDLNLFTERKGQIGLAFSLRF